MLKYLIIFIGVFIIFGLYWVLYYKRFNRVLKRSINTMYKTAPGALLIYLLLMGLVISLATSVNDVLALEKKVFELEQHIVPNYYLEEGFPNDEFEYVYTYYNQFFSGGYSEEGEMILCIKEGAPVELLQHLDNNQTNYIFVKHSYSDLLQLQQLISDSSSSFEGTVIISTNEKENKVTLSAENPEQLIELFQTYIDQQILEIILGGVIIY